MKTFEDYLQNVFIEESAGQNISITKDNCNDLFEYWLERKDIDELKVLADNYNNKNDKKL